MITRLGLGSFGYLVAAPLGCGGEYESSLQHGVSTSAAATSTQTVTTAGEPVSGATTQGSNVTTDTSAAALTSGATASGGNSSTGETTASSAGGGGEAPGCTGYCDPCPEGQHRYSCDPYCLCELDEDATRAEHERLLYCSWNEPCPPGAIYSVADAGDPIVSIFSEECLFTAFRNRTEGRFDLAYESHTGSAIDHTGYTFLLDGSDTIFLLRWGYASGPKGGANDQLTFAGVESCALADPSIFEACLAAPDSCVTVREWVTGCVLAQSPSCAAE